MTDLFIPQTILSQLNTNKIVLWSWGATNFVGHQENNRRGWLRFDVNGHHFKGKVKIKLDYNDTYTIEFIKTKRKKNQELSELFGTTKYDTITEIEQSYDGVYCDQLHDVIDRVVEYIPEYN